MIEQIALITFLLELIHRYRKVILIVILVILGLFILMIASVGNYESEKDKQLIQMWNEIEYGDSIFVKRNVMYLDFYKKGREPLETYEQREIKYKREDTLNFIKQNTVHEKYFYQNNTSFIGICIGKDTSVTEAGEYKIHKWIMIRPSYSISHPPQSDKYDYEARKWDDKSESYFMNGKLSKNFYVNLKDIQITNNDSIFIY